MKLLRYNSRINIYFPEGKIIPQINPTMRNSRGKGFNEPIWFWKLRKRVFCFAGNQRCPDRGTGTELLDSWNIGPDNNRTCSFCGSIHPEDFKKIVELSKKDTDYRIEGTTKNYKLYVKQPGVSNAGQGAIKFYTSHRI